MSKIDLAKAYEQLCAVVRPRFDMAEANIPAAGARLFRVLQEYPEPVAITALDLWPRQSEWFPTEKELRDLLDEVQAEASLSAAAREHVGGGRYNQPVGNTVPFVEKVRQIRGDGYVKSWLAGGVTAQFTANQIYLTGIGFDRLSKDFGALADECGVGLFHDPDVSRMLAQYCDQRELKFEPKRRGR